MRATRFFGSAHSTRAHGTARERKNEQDHAQQGPDGTEGHDRADQRQHQGLLRAGGPPRCARAIPRDRAQRGRRREILPRLRPLRPLHRCARHHRRGEGAAAHPRGVGEGAWRRRGVPGPRHQAGGQRQRGGQTPRSRLPQQGTTPARAAGQAGDAIRVRPRRHRHQRDDLRRPPREPGPQGRARARQGGRGRRRELRRRHPRTHHAGVRARRDRARPRHHPLPTSITANWSR